MMGMMKYSVVALLGLAFLVIVVRADFDSFEDWDDDSDERFGTWRSSPRRAPSWRRRYDYDDSDESDEWYGGGNRWSRLSSTWNRGRPSYRSPGRPLSVGHSSGGTRNPWTATSQRGHSASQWGGNTHRQTSQWQPATNSIWSSQSSQSNQWSNNKWAQQPKQQTNHWGRSTTSKWANTGNKWANTQNKRANTQNKWANTQNKWANTGNKWANTRSTSGIKWANPANKWTVSGNNYNTGGGKWGSSLSNTNQWNSRTHDSGQWRGHNSGRNRRW